MRMRKIALFAKKETVYGTAVALTGAEAIRTHELKVTPFAANTIERNLLDMTGQHPLPETLRPDRYFNLT